MKNKFYTFVFCCIFWLHLPKKQPKNQTGGKQPDALDIDIRPVEAHIYLYDPKGITLKFGFDKANVVDKRTMYQGK